MSEVFKWLGLSNEVGNAIVQGIGLLIIAVVGWLRKSLLIKKADTEGVPVLANADRRRTEDQQAQETLAAAWTEIRALRADAVAADTRNNHLWTKLQEERNVHEAERREYEGVIKGLIDERDLAKDTAKAALGRVEDLERKVKQLELKVVELQNGHGGTA